MSTGFPSAWSTSQTVNGDFIGGDQPTLYPGPGFGDIPVPGRVMLTLSCYRASGGPDMSVATGKGDINSKKAP
jgi:hypothetical protein